MVKQLALTYDDGPNDPHTLDLLDVLARHDVKATFFMIGMYVRQKPEIARRVAAEGHTIGNHTYTHPELRAIPFAQAAEEIQECERALKDVVGRPSTCFRAPYLLSTDEIDIYVETIGLMTITATSQGVDWHADTRPDDIVERVVRKQAGRSGIVLLHDGSQERMGEDRTATVQATDRLIVKFKQEGYAFAADPIGLTQPLVTGR